MARKHRLNVAILVLLAALAAALWAAPAAAAAGPVRILCLGDSLTAGLGLPPQQSFPHVLEQTLRQQGLAVEVINAGVSGDTTGGGLARLEWALGQGADLAIVELGANDMLRGLDPARAKANLDAIITKLKERGVAVLLTGMRAPVNLGERYAARFNGLYEELAHKHDVPLYPFFLAGVAGDPTLNQPDGLHPNAQGVRVIVKNISPLVARLVRTLIKKSNT